MAEYLTDKNGVTCHACFVTIDLTKLERKETPNWVKTLRKIADEPTHFMVTCPHCHEKRTYSYKDDVKPIADIEQMKKVYQEEITKFVEKYLDAKTDIVALLKEVAKQELLGTENSKDNTDKQSKEKSAQTLEHFK